MGKIWWHSPYHMEAYISQHRGGVQHAYLHSHLTLHLSSYPGEQCIWKGWTGQGVYMYFATFLRKLTGERSTWFFSLHLFALNKNTLYIFWTSWDLFSFTRNTETYLKVFAFENLVCKGNAWEGVIWRLVLSNRCRWKNRFLMEQITAENAFWTSLYSCNKKLAPLVFMGVILGILWRNTWE